MKRVEYGKGAPQHIHKYKSKEFKGLFHCIIVVKVLLISEHNKGSHLVRGRYSRLRRHTQKDAGRHRQTQTDTGRHRQTQVDTERHRQTQADTDRRRQTQAHTDRHRQTQTGTDRHRQTQTDTDRHR